MNTPTFLSRAIGTKYFAMWKATMKALLTIQEEDLLPIVTGETKCS